MSRASVARHSGRMNFLRNNVAGRMAQIFRRLVPGREPAQPTIINESGKRQRECDDAAAPSVPKKARVELPEGMSRSHWKKLEKKKRWEESKPQYREFKRQKKKAAKERRRLAVNDPENTSYHQQKRPKQLPEQESSDVRVIMDCSFDHLMNEKEIVSLSSQVTRCYSAMRFAKHDVGLQISGFNKLLKERFDTSVDSYQNWKKIEFIEKDLENILPEERANYIYLTPDTEETIQTLEKGKTYIIGGIVDKNRHKMLCLNRAQELGLQVARLPIDESIQISGRKVLATSHVYEIMLKWLELKDWGKAFMEVLPPRKLKSGEPKAGDDVNEDKVGEDEEVEAVEQDEEVQETVEETIEETVEETK